MALKGMIYQYHNIECFLLLLILRRWYDIPLTDEEILLGVRLGCVCVGIGPSFDTSSSPPCVDAVEVYGKKREDISYLSLFNHTSGSKLLKNYRSSSFIESKSDNEVDKKGFEENSRNALLSSIKCIVVSVNYVKNCVIFSQFTPNSKNRYS